MAIDFPLTPAQPFSLTLPSTATVNSAGEVVCDLSANATEAMAAAVAAQATADDAVADAAAAQGDATQALSDAADAQTTADDAVPKTDIVMLGPVRVDLIVAATGTTHSWRALFDGTLINAAMVLDGAETAVGDCGVTISITNGAVTLSAPLTQPLGTAAGAVRTVTAIGGPWLFSASDFFTITTTSANTAATFGGITLGVTRA